MVTPRVQVWVTSRVPVGIFPGLLARIPVGTPLFNRGFSCATRIPLGWVSDPSLTIGNTFFTFDVYHDNRLTCFAYFIKDEDTKGVYQVLFRAFRES